MMKLKDLLLIAVFATIAFVIFVSRGYETVIESDDKNTYIEPVAETPLSEKVGTLLMVGVPGPVVDTEMKAFLAEVQPGGVVLFNNDLGGNNSNIQSKGQVSQLISDIKAIVPNVLVAVDAEGGAVNRLTPEYGFTNAMPSAAWLGNQSTSTTYDYAQTLATESQSVGFDLNFAPVVDVAVNGENPVIVELGRSYGVDPERVTEQAAVFIAAHQVAGVHTALKHFPGHGSSLHDSHLGFTDVTNTYDSDIELQPYRELITSGYKDFIMTAHITHADFGGVPATLSSVVLTDLLRDELGFTGVVITDDLQMGAIIEQYGEVEAAIMALQAGADMILLANQKADYTYTETILIRDAVVAAVERGDLAQERINEAYDRITSVSN